MMKFRKRTIKEILLSLPVVFLLGLLVFMLGRSLIGVYERNQIARESQSEAREEIERLEAQKEELERELERLQTERGLEEELRTKLQVARPDEETVVLVDPEEEEESTEGKGLWQKIKDLF